MDILAATGEELKRRDAAVLASLDAWENDLDKVDRQQLLGLFTDVANRKASAMSVKDIAIVRFYKCRSELILDECPELCARL